MQIPEGVNSAIKTVFWNISIMKNRDRQGLHKKHKLYLTGSDNESTYRERTKSGEQRRGVQILSIGLEVHIFSN